MKMFLFAGEVSGDNLGESIVQSILTAYPSAEIFGVGGPKMIREGLTPIYRVKDFEVMGFVDVLPALPKLTYRLHALTRRILNEKPDLVLTIDYPGFSLALHKALSKKGFKGAQCHYVCPSVWAWGKRRIPKMEKYLDHLFVTFPFEKHIFNPEKLPSTYVGHPLAADWPKRGLPLLDLPKEKRIVALFPGSRKKELFRNFPLQLECAKKLLEKHVDLYFIVSVANPSFSRHLDHLLRESSFPDKNKILFLDSSHNASLMQKSTLAIAKSGTNNLELALHGIPTVVIYGVGPLDLAIAKYLLRIRLPHYCIVNIAYGERVYPELIGPNLTLDRLVYESNRFLSSKEAHEDCRKKCVELAKLLRAESQDKVLADSIKSLLTRS